MLYICIEFMAGLEHAGIRTHFLFFYMHIKNRMRSLMNVLCVAWVVFPHSACKVVPPNPLYNDGEQLW
jgi:hypothetical protein